MNEHNLIDSAIDPNIIIVFYFYMRNFNIFDLESIFCRIKPQNASIIFEFVKGKI